MAQISHDAQAHTLRLFTLLTALRPGWAGSLILSCGLSPAGSDLALAANIAGATCLSIERSPDACHAALRFGAVDFVVNSLDEALRALKNEIRKGHPLSVALQADPAATLSAILNRGVLPDLFTAFPTGPGDPDVAAFRQAAGAWTSMDVPVVDFNGTLMPLPPTLDAPARLQAYTTEHGLSLESFQFDSASALRDFDARVLDVIPTSDSRRRWAVSAPRHFQRSRFTEVRSHRRALYLTRPEHDLLAPTPPSDTQS